jgi:lysophospholipase L1-like esterase
MRIFSSLIAITVVLFSSLHSRAEVLVKNGESIAFLGDSITYFGAENPGGYVRLVESGLAAQGIKVTAINAGWGGNTSRDMSGRLENHVLSKKPTWMTLSAGVNDVMHTAVELEEYKKNITSILDRAQAAGVKVVVLTASQIGLPVTGTANVKLAGYNNFLRETAKARNLPLADLNAAMVTEQTAFEKAGIKRVLTTDGVHMNVYGNMVMAKGVLSAFGLNAVQLAAAEAKWNESPELFQATAKIKLSANQLTALKSYTDMQYKPFETVVSGIATTAVNAAVKTMSVPSGTAAQAKKNDVSGISETVAKIKLSASELAALEAYAATQHKSVETMVSEISTAALTSLLETASVPSDPAHFNTAAVPTNRGTEEQHQALNAAAKKGNIDLLFIGDSITMAWKSDGSGVWDERYAPLNAANFGLGGDKIEHVLWRLQNGNLEGIKPKVVVLLIGTNNVGRISSEDIAWGITAVVKEINTRLPEAKVMLMGLFPRGETPDNPHRIQVKEVNAIISKLDDGKRVFFTDIGSQMMLPDGSISKEYLPDLLHLSGKGYELWADSIQAKIDKFMK